MSQKCFPVYDTFKSQAEKLPPWSDENKQNAYKIISSNIEKLEDQKGKDTLYQIIRHSAEIDQSQDIYGCVPRKKVVYFELIKFPELLLKIIDLFLKKHIQSTTETVSDLHIILD